MSTTSHITIWCDAEGCSEWVMGEEDDRTPAARAMAKRRGWTYVRGLDYCPADRPNA